MSGESPYIGFQFDGQTFSGLFEVLRRAEEIAARDGRTFDRNVCGLLADPKFRGMPQYLGSVAFREGSFELVGIEPAEAGEGGGS